MKENNLVIREKKESVIIELMLMVSGVIFLGMTSKISILLPFTPVPITGQTFGVLLIGLTYGKKLGLKTIGLYILGGTLGLPIFGTAGLNILLLKPTGGYLIGQILMVLICGSLIEKKWAKSYFGIFGIMLLAEIAMYTCGLLHLSFFVKSNVLELGLFPFLIGDFIKMILVAFLVPSVTEIMKTIKK